jgi:hypothetical protein
VPSVWSARSYRHELSDLSSEQVLPCCDYPRQDRTAYVGKRSGLAEVVGHSRVPPQMLSAIPTSKNIAEDTQPITPPRLNYTQFASVPFAPEEIHPASRCQLLPLPIDILALWDTGASDSYIDADCPALKGQTLLTYPKPIELRLFDGNLCSAGQLTQYIDTTI